MTPFDGGQAHRDNRQVTERKAPNEAVAAALQRWALRVRDAHWELGRDLVDCVEGNPIAVNPRRALGERPWEAVQIASYLANLFTEGPLREELHPVEAAIIDRLSAALRPRLNLEKAVLAADLVREHAPRYQLATSADASYKGNTPAAIVNQFAIFLCSLVHEGFVLHPDDFGRLLQRFSASRGKRTVAGKGKGHLSAEQIVVELNRLARYPLSRDLNYRSIQNERRKLTKAAPKK